MAINILLADSGHLYRDILKNALADESVRIVLVRSIVEALDAVAKEYFHCFVVASWNAIHEQRYDILICDIVLGGHMTGSRFINRIRRQPAPLGNILILATTAFDNAARRIELFHLGIDDYVAKPILPLELKARIQNLLVRKRSEETLLLQIWGHGPGLGDQQTARSYDGRRDRC
ncbi:PleD family two-component system response regulator [Zoogloea sp. LCSB751]|uniref:response regulator n=1 Tax=Zoogloea sp. LCSB751 TaxID=1965277 RepID=UPI0009A4F348|nr:response regulator [Zoogloea sp. LCSB751]